MLRFQPTVRVSYLDAELATILKHASVFGLRAGKTVVVFSVEDLKHMDGSLHYFSLAVDLDVEGNVRADLEGLYAWLRRWLPSGYDVVFEDNHVHVEYDQHRPDALAPAPK